MNKAQYDRMIELETPYAKDNASLTFHEKRELLGLFAIHEAHCDAQNEQARLEMQGVRAVFPSGSHCGKLDQHAFSGAVSAGEY